MTYQAQTTRIGREGGATAAADMAPPAPQRVSPESLLAQTFHRFRRSYAALLGLGIVTLLIVVAIFADVLAPYPPIRISQNETYQTPSAKHFLGTDQLGRDMLSRIIHGSRLSLAVGLSSILLAIFVGVPWV